MFSAARSYRPSPPWGPLTLFSIFVRVARLCSSSAPALLLLVHAYPTIGDLYKAYKGPANVYCFALVVVVGALLETAMTYLEKRWDGRVEKTPRPLAGKDGWVYDDWYDYLSRKFGDNEPVGYRYLSKTVTSLYFELGMFVSVPLALSAVLGILLLQHVITVAAAIILIAIAILVACWRYKCAKDTHLVLCKTRAQINSRLGPSQTPQP